MSTVTSPLSSLFSPVDDLRCSDLVTSDEEPDLWAFTAVLRAWGYLLPPLRIQPTAVLDSSSGSNSPRSVDIDSESNVLSPTCDRVSTSAIVNDNTTSSGESDIIIAYSPSTDQPVLDFPRPRCSGIRPQPLVFLQRNHSFIVDDTSSPLPCHARLPDMTHRPILLQPPPTSNQSSFQPPAYPFPDPIAIPEPLPYRSFSSQADQPSLGYLDEALSFIAQERARWSAARSNRASNNGVQTLFSQRTCMSTGTDRLEREHEDEHEHDMDTGDSWRRYTIGDYFPLL